MAAVTALEVEHQAGRHQGLGSLNASQYPIHKGNTISVSYNGSVAEAFYQPVPYWATDDVNVLYPKFNMSPEIALFICAIIKREKYRFNYGRKWHLERMRSHEIKLPVKFDGSIDFDFMESYIQALPYNSQISSNQITLSGVDCE